MDMLQYFLRFTAFIL